MALTDNLISVWHMNNDAWQDSWGTNHGTAYGATFSASAKLGSHAGSFDAIDDYTQVKTAEIISKLANHSMSCWVYVTDLSSQRDVYSEGKSSDPGGGHWWSCDILTNGLLEFHLYGAGSNYNLYTPSDGDVITVNNWYHIVCTLGAGGMKIYVNGKYKANDANTDPSTSTTNFSFIGKRVTPYAANLFKGRMDELALWSKTLTDGGVSVGQTATGEVAELYNAGVGIEVGAVTAKPYYYFMQQ